MNTDREGRSVYHVLPHFHYDVVYQKTYEDYLAVTLPIVRKALRMIETVPGFTFGVETTCFLEEFVRRFPRQRRRLARALRSGRMEVTCGMYCMPDGNLPCGEGLIRQIIRGRTWLKDQFGVEPRTCMMTDTFGHPRQFPQILKQCGYDYFVFSRGMHRIAPTEFWWKGVDGTKILTHWNYRGYGSGFSWVFTGERNWPELRDSAQDIARRATTDQALLLLGGDFCLPHDHSAEALRRITRQGERARFSTLTGYLDAVAARRPRLRTLARDLNPLFAGCYSTRIRIKQLNRQAENGILALETLGALAGLTPSDRSALAALWDAVLLHQFHDTICGSIIDAADRWALDSYGRTLRRLSRLSSRKLAQLAGSGSRRRSGPAWAVFNSTAETRAQAIALSAAAPIAGRVLVDSAGTRIPVQRTGAGAVFVDALPSVGLKTYRLAGMRRRPPSSLRVSAQQIENRFFRIRLSDGVIRSVVDKSTGQEFVDPRRPFFNNLVLQRDDGDPWVLYRQPVMGDTWKICRHPDPMPERIRYKQLYFECTDYYAPSARTDAVPCAVEVLERGPVRAGLKVSGQLSMGRALCVAFEQSVFLYDALRRIDFTTRIFPRGKRYRLRACFATPFRKPTITHEIPCGAEQRPAEECPALNWADYRERGRGLLVLNRGLPGNNFQDGVAMLSLFRSVTSDLIGNMDGAYEEGEEHVFEYAAIPYVGDAAVEPALEGQCYNRPPQAGVVRSAPLATRSFLDISPANVILSAFYRTQAGYVLRVYESAGRRTRVQALIRLPVRDASPTNALGQEQGASVSLENGVLSFDLRPFEIRTYRLHGTT